MAHPNGGQGNYFHPNHTFDQAFAYVGELEVPVISTTGERIWWGRPPCLPRGFDGKKSNTSRIVYL
jgi:hypothetical protein